MIRERSIETSKGVIRYKQTNERENNLIYFHGGFGDNEVATILEKVFGDKYCIVLPLLPWHGSFNPGGIFDYKDLVSTMTEFPNALKIRNYVRLGHSLGGRILLDASKQTEDQVLAQVLISPLLTSVEPRLVRMGFNLITGYRNELGNKSEIKLEHKTLITRLKNLQHIWKIVRSLGEVEKMNFTIPTTIIWGLNDSALPFEKNKSAIGKLEGAKLVKVEGGHYWMFKEENLRKIRTLLESKQI